jgi:hypothetical protein
MNVYACRLMGVGCFDVAVVMAETVEELFWYLDEICSPYQYEIVKLTKHNTGVINLTYMKKVDEDGDEYSEPDEEHPISYTELVNVLPDVFETHPRYRIDKKDGEYVLIKLKKKEMPFG